MILQHHVEPSQSSCGRALLIRDCLCRSLRNGWLKRAERLPGEPVLIKLLEAGRRTEEQVIYDYYGFDKTYAQLLSDILATRDVLRLNLPSSELSSNGLITEDRPYVASLTNGGYEFIVAFFAIRALGGACFSFCKYHIQLGPVNSVLANKVVAAAMPEEEAYHYLSDAQAIGILSGKSNLPQAKDKSDYKKFLSIPFMEVITNSPPIDIASVTIDKSLLLEPRGPGVVMCTYDTTGIPKAAILPGQCAVQTQSP